MKTPKKSSENIGRNTRANKRRGNKFECKIVKELKELGFDVVTSRSESKNLDDKKVDIFDKENILPYIQTKLTQSTPNYFQISSECPLKDKPFVIIWSKTVPTERTFRSVGEVAIVPKDYFYTLIKHYYGK